MIHTRLYPETPNLEKETVHKKKRKKPQEEKPNTWLNGTQAAGEPRTTELLQEGARRPHRRTGSQQEGTRRHRGSRKELSRRTYMEPPSEESGLLAKLSVLLPPEMQNLWQTNSCGVDSKAEQVKLK